ncbi:hypothetical protein C5Y96_22875 [Blastopirellula marina]|uniref:Glycine zipper domain-containing protein n=1 Tax=Blastopirellula marina TaxID=124 RepID=A0A2S8F0G7_9BACT|nr:MULTISPECIES: hypothetical protein [Pirellulaceae]PQO25668.1 hypothetical protein C5Y96_22875 [Blastopirellula marina]RCS43351.1 hypothetical protein DTL36_22925 [Bremerella cremea]
MRKLLVLGMVVLGVTLLAHQVMAQGALRGGMRGAAVGGLVGGKSGASTGAKVGVVTGATRGAINRESQARTQYQSTPEYQNYQGVNFNESSPNVILESEVTTTETTQPVVEPAAKPATESVIRLDGKPIVGVTFPADWKQRTGENYISAVSPDGQCWGMFVTIKSTTDVNAAMKKVEDGLQSYMTAIRFDKQTEGKNGSVVMTGTGKGKKAGADLNFAVGVFDAGNNQLVAAGFAVDAKLDDHYKETVRGICETIRRSADFNSTGNDTQ